MPFDADFQHWPTIAAFTAYLQGVPRPSWCTGLTNHNSYQPDERNWAGMKSMISMRDHYRDVKKWPSGPHLFLVAAAPLAVDTGIWQMTPLARPGVHAGACNAHHIGIENVGDFDRAPPSPAQYTLLLAVNRAILEHWGLSPASVNVHNECMSGRTCPGKFLTGAQIRADLNATWPRVPPPVSLPTDQFARWGAVGKPTGAAVNFAVPRAWLVNQVLGACVEPETYSATGKYSITEFKAGLILYFKARNTTIVELFS